MRRTQPSRVGVGGRRPSTAEARFTAQIIGLVLPEVKTRILDMCKRHGVSQSVAVRTCVANGIDAADEQLGQERASGLR